jgi:hypothetical protein
MTKDEYGEWAIRLYFRITVPGGKEITGEVTRRERGTKEAAERTAGSRQKATLRVDYPGALVSEIRAVSSVLEIAE